MDWCPPPRIASPPAVVRYIERAKPQCIEDPKHLHVPSEVTSVSSVSSRSLGIPEETRIASDGGRTTLPKGLIRINL